MSLRAFVSLLVLGGYAVCASAQPEVGVSELPGWVEQLPIEEFDNDRTAEFRYGIANLLSDRQVRRTDRGFDYAQRSVYRIVDRSGLESSATIARAFDPESETLFFNFVRILRDGQVIDRLTGAEITLLRQEEGLGSGIIDGNVTALIQLEDIRVGDVIDYSYSGSVVSPLWPDEFFDMVSVELPVPLAQMHYKLSVPERTRLNVRAVSTEAEPEIALDDGWRSYTLQVFDPDPMPFELDVAADWVTYGFVAFSSMDSWSDVAAWAVPLFSFDEPLPDEFAARLDAIADAYERSEDRIVQVLRLVQSDIRYLGLEVGLGSHVPRPPAVTLERGYGDCKDKAVLLVAALNYLGIDAVPALASVFDGELLPQFLPMIGAFDHVIVEVDLDGEKTWLDPTLSHQGGSLENLASLGYGHVLPVRAGQSDLVALNEPVADRPMFEIVETFEFPEADDTGLRVSVEQIHRDYVADAMRFQVASMGREALVRGFFDYYAANYEVTTETSPLAITDDLEANELVFRSRYEMDAAAFRQSDYGNNLPIFATAVQDMLPRQVEARRTAPLALPYGTNARHLIRIVTPGRRFPLPESKSTTAGGVSYAQSFRQHGDTLEIEYTLKVDEKSVELGAIRPITDIANEIALNTELTLYMQSAMPTFSRRMGLTTPIDQQTEAALESISQRISEERYVDALTAINTLLGEHTQANDLRGILQLMKGVTLLRLRRGEAALEPFDEAFALYEPLTPESYFFYASVLSREREDERAAQLIVRMLERHPEAPDGVNLQWILDYLRYLSTVELEAERENLLLALAEALRDSEPTGTDTQWVFSEAVTILAREQDVPGASQYLGLIRDPEEISKLLASRETEAIWDVVGEHAGPGLSKAIDRYVSSTREAAEEAPDDFLRQTFYVMALRMAGRFEEALEFAEPIAANWPRIEAVGTDAYWFVNEYAAVLSDAGYADEAHAVMDRLIDIGVAENRQLVSMAINRAATLMHWANFEAALSAAEALENLGDGYASDYGRMWIFHVKACSLYQLARVEESEAVLRDSISPISDRNPSANTGTLLCLDQPEKAAETMIDRLRGESTRADAVVTFIHATNQPFLPPFLAELRERAERVRAMPTVQQALNEVGRAISISGPKAYWGDF